MILEFKYTLDDKLIVVNNYSGHKFAIGELVTVMGQSNNKFKDLDEAHHGCVYFCRNESHDFWYVFDDDVKLALSPDDVL